MTRFLAFLLVLAASTARRLDAAPLWRSDAPLANSHLRFDFEATGDAVLHIDSAPGAAIAIPLGAARSGTVEFGLRQREGEPGEVGAWLDGEPLGEARHFGAAATATGGTGPSGARFVSGADEARGTFDLSRDFTAYTRFRTRSGGGALFAKSKPGQEWIRGGKTLYLRNGRATYDIGWVGAIGGGPRLDDGEWHEVVVVAGDGGAALYVDGEEVARRADFSAPPPEGARFVIGACAEDFGGDFTGEIAAVRLWRRSLSASEAEDASGGEIAEINTADFFWQPEADDGDAAGASDPAVIDGFLAYPVTVRAEPAGAVTIGEVTVGALAEADHPRMVSAWDHNSLERGARIYNGLCITCHGNDTIEGTLPTAMRFHEGEFKNGKDPLSLYNTLTKGFNQMMPQPWMTPQQKWDVIHYIRETLVKPHNPSQYTEADAASIASLPRGLGLGPEVTVAFGQGEPKWKQMDYGPVQFWTIQVAPGNIAYKGIAVRLDEGPGGVAAGNKWALYDHDLMRVAAVWQGDGYIDWKGIAFDQSHGTHSSIVGEPLFVNPVAPGVMSQHGEHEDPRFLGRDGLPYGPLPRDWTQYKGTYMHGNRPVIHYSVGGAQLLELPGYEIMGETTVFTRTIQVSQDGPAPILRVAPPGTAVVAKGAKIEDEGEFVTAYLQPGSRAKIFVAAADQADLEAYAATAGDAIDLTALTRGGPQRWPQTVTTTGKASAHAARGFEADEITLPEQNPWRSWMRIGGFDFLPGGDRAAVATWLGDVFIVDGIGAETFGEHRWQRIATGLFQPLGVKVVDGTIHVCCRDQIAKLNDLNGDGEIDHIECFNNDHQVTEHFHEFAMGLQTDDDGNFYYAKSARHAKTALVPHHGTLLRVSEDGARTDILATGFRAANGVCLNPDGTFIVTDQEGHWNPKNRINYVKEGGFYGNMYGYHDVTDESDGAMEQPLCWITNAFDRSPAELMWVPEDAAWGPLNGKLLNLSYGTGKIFLVPHETIGGQAQGGMISLGLQFPTGVMRGRFHPEQRQLFATGMFAWAGSARGDGGFSRIRHTGVDPALPVELRAREGELTLTFTSPVDTASVTTGAFKVEAWDLKRTKGYGSKHFDQRRLQIAAAQLAPDGRSVTLAIPELAPTWGMSIDYQLRDTAGDAFEGSIHNSIHRLPE